MRSSPRLDRAELDESKLDEDQRAWRRDGFLIKLDFIPDALIDAYCAIRARVPDPGGWACPVPYVHVPELRAISLYPPLTPLLGHLVGEEMGGCTST